MAAFRIAGFSGLVPRLAKQLLSPNQAQVATNCILTSGDLRPRNGPLLIASPVIANDIKSMFRMEKDGNEKWLAWDKDVDVARSPIAANTERRFYYTGDGEPRVSDYDTATAGIGPYPSGCFVLGVTPPITKPSVSASGGTGADVTRAYVYTFVTPWGEESAPSPASTLATGKESGATWALSGMDVAPPNSGTVTGAVKDTPSAGYVEITLDKVYGLRAGETVTFSGVTGMTDLNGAFTLNNVDSVTKKVRVILSTTQTYSSGGTWTRQAPHNTNGMNKRIYRTLTTSSGTEYHYVVTIAAITATYSDTASDETVALGEVLPSTTWLMPPADLKGIVILANGIAAGFTGNEVCFSEPFKPYAWPTAYRQTYDQDIVAIGVTGTTLVGMTKGNPFSITGVDPVTMGGGMEKLGVAWPCMAKRGMASFAFGVGYPAPQGLVIAGINTDIVTKDLFTQKEWAELNPNTFIAASADNRYYCGYTVDDSSLMFVIDKAESASFIKVNQKITAIWADPWTGKLYVAADKKIYQWEGDVGTKLAYEWKSKKFITAPPINYGAAKIDADFDMTEAESASSGASFEASIAANQALIDGRLMDDGLADAELGERELCGDAMESTPSLVIDSLQFQLWADGVLKFTKQVTNTRAFRLPGGYKADNVEVVLSGNVKVTGVVLAETMDGLKGA
ncbi:hypothetical protein SAMN05216428_102385 [Nitrosospira sp. Nsp11]|uniref:ubiquitin-activating E1 FCCH domain-containing protein n=1 Tax=Nitrosospira sp. Nsp11 TaxID=1855338 RepID=UPI000910BE60|nr:ubiquitin-activating E1 FCCH domain-containing protein [Nitrosospira sp. Nsp11]SHL43100.1 hypothetical protein SAMN05216428_102385 [Nitrosospira sp. Nsp11]